MAENNGEALPSEQSMLQHFCSSSALSQALHLAEPVESVADMDALEAEDPGPGIFDVVRSHRTEDRPTDISQKHHQAAEQRERLCPLLFFCRCNAIRCRKKAPGGSSWTAEVLAPTVRCARWAQFSKDELMIFKDLPQSHAWLPEMLAGGGGGVKTF